jgi:hypothetical protein
VKPRWEGVSVFALSLCDLAWFAAVRQHRER